VIVAQVCVFSKPMFFSHPLSYEDILHSGVFITLRGLRRRGGGEQRDVSFPLLSFGV